MSTRVLALLLTALLTAACSATPADLPAAAATDDTAAEALAELDVALAGVSEGQDVADRAVNDVLEVVRAVDETVAQLAAPAGFDEAVAAHAEDVHPRVTATTVDELRQGYLDVAATVDDARQTLASARAVLDDPWEQEYLDAQDAVLLAVREYARTADRLAQLLVQHWPTYADVDATITDFAGRRGNYRDTQEAVDALAVEIDTALDELAVAQAQIAEHRARRTTAGRAVNDATADAVTVFERRPQ